MPSFRVIISPLFYLISPSSHHHSASISTIILSPFHHYSYHHFMPPFHIISPYFTIISRHHFASISPYFTIILHHSAFIFTIILSHLPLFSPSFCTIISFLFIYHHSASISITMLS